MKTDKMIPIDFSRNITPMVIGDDCWNDKTKEKFTLDDFGVSVLNTPNRAATPHLYVVSFADRPNTGKQPVGDDVYVDFLTKTCAEWEDDYPAYGLNWGNGSIGHWRINHAAMLKQWQAEQLAEEAKRMDNITMNGNDGDHYEQAHHVALQVEGMLDVINIRDFVIAIEANGDKIKTINPGIYVSEDIEIIDPDNKTKLKFHTIDEDGKMTPVFTKAMSDAGMLPSIGCECKLYNKIIPRSNQEPTVTIEFINCNGVLITYIDSGGSNFITDLDTFGFKPIDLKSDEDKLRDALIWETGEFHADRLLSSDKFIIKLKEANNDT